jgi:hypothetical protein
MVAVQVDLIGKLCSQTANHVDRLHDGASLFGVGIGVGVSRHVVDVELLCILPLWRHDVSRKDMTGLRPREGKERKIGARIIFRACWACMYTAT